ncbi:unnamed protein product [Gongylonema pulchrum]|uniref:HTH_48 domain-containing protein n=1 Tax=Gongylonema pulchrum TaxID=637853 RepID=A0A183ETB5_9BILA|nr:unnamed protein product [Gongylonema pulchrum]
MYQGFMIAIIYCFTNKEVRNVLKTCYGRYKLQHTSTVDLRRGSRTTVLRNGSASGRSPKKNGILRIQKYAIKNGRDTSVAALVAVNQVMR